MKYIGRTDTGRVRENNEDAFDFVAEANFAVLADGMGGLNAGEVASAEAVAAAVAAVHELSPGAVDESGLADVLQIANRRVFELSASKERFHNMGTTIVGCVLTEDGHWVTGHVGDSRAYLLRNQVLLPLTRDHSVVQQMVDEGYLSQAEARLAPNRNIITRALGLEAEVVVELGSVPSRADDLVLICSDGLSDLVEPAMIKQILLQHKETQGSAALDTACAELVAVANEAGGSDNITVVLLAPNS